MKISNSVKILKYLMMGKEIEIDDMVYTILSDDEGHYELCYKLTCENKSIDVICDMTLNDFIKLCENIDEEKMALLVMNYTVQKVLRK